MIALGFTLMVAAANPSQPRDVALANNTNAFHNLLVAQADMPPPPPPGSGYEGWSRGQLQMEYDRLEGTKPSIVGPIVLLSVGGALTIVGASVIFSWFGYWSTFVVGVIVGSVFLVPGIILVIVGAVMLPGRLAERRDIGARQDAIKARIDYAPPDGSPGMGPPPPPPPGAQQNLLDVQPSFALLAF